MQHDDLIDHLNRRFDRLEEKLDDYQVKTIETKQDVTWLKGYVKVSLSALVTLGGAILAYLLHTFTGK